MSPSPGWMSGAYHKMDILESFGKQFKLHPLLLEDIANTDQLPKLDDYETCLFLVMKMLSVTDRQEIVVEQVSLVLDRTSSCPFRKTGPTCLPRYGIDFVVAKDACGSPGPTTCFMRWSTPLSIDTSRRWKC